MQLIEKNALEYIGRAFKEEFEFAVFYHIYLSAEFDRPVNWLKYPKRLRMAGRDTCTWIKRDGNIITVVDADDGEILSQDLYLLLRYLKCKIVNKKMLPYFGAYCLDNYGSAKVYKQLNT